MQVTKSAQPKIVWRSGWRRNGFLDSLYFEAQRNLTTVVVAFLEFLVLSVHLSHLLMEYCYCVRSAHFLSPAKQRKYCISTVQFGCVKWRLALRLNRTPRCGSFYSFEKFPEEKRAWWNNPPTSFWPWGGAIARHSPVESATMASSFSWQTTSDARQKDIYVRLSCIVIATTASRDNQRTGTHEWTWLQRVDADEFICTLRCMQTERKERKWTELNCIGMLQFSFSSFALYTL